MADNPSPKRRCTQPSRKRLLECTRDFCSKRLTELTEQELNAYLQALGWPKAPSDAVRRWLVDENIAVWVLNKVLTQLKKWMTLRNTHKSSNNHHDNTDVVKENGEENANTTTDGGGGGDGDDDNGGEILQSVTMFRYEEIRLIAYLLASIHDVNALHVHSHVLIKMVAISNVWNEVNLEQIASDGGVSTCMKVLSLKGNENKIEEYMHAVTAIDELLRALYFQSPHITNMPRPGNRICMGINLNDIATQVIDDVTTFAIWNQAFQRIKTIHGNKKNAINISTIAVAVAQHLGIMVEVLWRLLESNTNVKSAYNCLVQKLMDHLLYARADIEDFRTHATVLLMKNGTWHKDCCMEKMNDVMDETGNSIMRAICFPLAPKFVPGLREMLASKDYEDLMDVEQLGNMGLEYSAVAYNRQFLLKIVMILHQAQKDIKVLQQARGICIMLPTMFKLILDELDAQKQNAKETSFYGAMLIAVILPLVEKLATEMRSNTEVRAAPFIYSAALIDAVDVFHSILKLANNRQILVYSGERSEIVTKLNEKAVEFVISCLQASYKYLGKNVKRQTLMEDITDKEKQDSRLLIRKFQCENPLHFRAISIIQTIPMLWDALMLLVSLSLEYADTNIQPIMQLLHKDFAMDDNEKYEEEAFNMLANPAVVVDSTKRYKESQIFAATLVSMYSHANDMPTLVDHIGKFVKSLRATKEKCIFLTHPPAIQAFHNSSRESAASQMPIVIGRFTTWLKKDGVKDHLQYPLICYLSGIEMTATVATKFATAFETLLRTVCLRQTPESVLMALYSTITIRKINAWLTMDDSNLQWGEHVQNIYKYVSEITEMVGDDCSLEVWKALFWFAYHISLLVRDHPFLYGNMEEGVYMIFKTLGNIVQANADKREFILVASTLITANANVFGDLPVYYDLIKVTTGKLASLEKDENLMEKIRDTVEALTNRGETFSDIFDMDLLMGLVKSMGQEQATTKMKSDVLHIVKMVLETSTKLFKQDEFVSLFNQLVEAAKQTGRCDHFEKVEVVIMVHDMVALLLFVLRREVQLETNACSVLAVKDFVRALAIGVNFDLENKVNVNIGDGVLCALNDIKGAIKFVPGQGIKHTVAALQQIAELYNFLIAKVKNEEFMKQLQEVKTEEDIMTNLVPIIATTLIGREEEKLVLKVIGKTNDEETGSFTKSLSDAVVLAKVVKMMQTEDKTMEDTPIWYVTASKRITKVLGMLTNLIKSYYTEDAAYMVYLSSLLYVISTNIEPADIATVFKYIARLNTRMHIMKDMEPDLLETLCDIILRLVDRIVKRSTGRQLKAHAVPALSCLASIQQLICVKRRGLLGNKGTQLEVFKALCGIHVEQMSNIVQTFFVKAKSIDTWKAFTEHVDYLYHQAENQETPYNWLFRVAALEVMMLLMDKQHMKALANIKGESKRLVLSDIEAIIRLHSKHLAQASREMGTHLNLEAMHWIVINYLMNTAISIKVFVFTRFHVNKKFQLIHYAFSEQLLDLARMGIDFMQPGSAYAEDETVHRQIATNVYLCLYNCIRTVEGLSNAQAAKLARPWMKRVHVVVYIITQFVGLIESQDADMFADVARWMNIVSDAQLKDATRWYMPHMLTAIIRAWFRVNKDIATTKGGKSEILRSNKILKSCITDSISSCDNTALQTLFLLLPTEVRRFVKENTNVFNRN